MTPSKPMPDPSDLVERPGRYTPEADAAIEQLQALGFDFAEADMIYHGDMLGRRLGAKASQALISLQAERDEARTRNCQLSRALSNLVGRHGNFCAYLGQPHEAYRALVTGAQDLWDDARVALGNDTTGAAERIVSITDRLSAAEAEIGRMREALEPFAELGEVVLAEAPPDAIAARSFRGTEGHHIITLDTFHRARAALQPTGKTST